MAPPFRRASPPLFSLSLLRLGVTAGVLFAGLWALALVFMLESEPATSPTLPSIRKLKKAGGGSAAAAVEVDDGLYHMKDWVIYITPTPTPPPVVPDVFNTRNCVCVDDWREVRAADPKASLCSCDGAKCPPDVDPRFLTDALGQGVCSLKQHTGYSCTVGCAADGKVHWYGAACGGTSGRECPQLVATISNTPTSTPTRPPAIVPPALTWDPAAVMDLRGAGCELKGGKEVCFVDDTQGRTLCPAYVTSQMLAFPPKDGQTSMCTPEHAATHYCTIECQPGNDRIHWNVHDLAYCYSAEHQYECPKRPEVVPKEGWVPPPWNPPRDPPLRCRIEADAGVKPPGVVKRLTVGMLTHEPVATTATLATYEANDFFSVVDEFLVYMNNRHPALEALFTPLQAKYPGKIKILGDATNVGIARGIVYLTGNASNPNFMLLERDFRLIEPATCVYEQLTAGVEMVETGKIHVVRYRSRRHAGRPNWAEIFFKGHERDGFIGRQPNLGCNAFYWVWNVLELFPEYFWLCGNVRCCGVGGSALPADFAPFSPTSLPPSEPRNDLLRRVLLQLDQQPAAVERGVVERGVRVPV